MLKFSIGCLLVGLGASQVRRMAPQYTGSSGKGDGYQHAYRPVNMVRDTVDGVRDVTGMPLDGSLLPVDPTSIEDLHGYTGKCHETVNLVQIVPSGDNMEPSKYAHIKRMVHFMLDGFTLSDRRSHASVITCGQSPEVLFGLSEPMGRSNVEARRRTGNMKPTTGRCSMGPCLQKSIELVNLDLRPEAINVVIIHTDGDFDNAAQGAMAAVAEQTGIIPRLVPVVVSYGDQLFSHQDRLTAMVQFAECLDLEFCPNLIPAKWSAPSLISTQLAVKQYIATAVRAMPPHENIIQ